MCVCMRARCNDNRTRCYEKGRRSLFLFSFFFILFYFGPPLDAVKKLFSLLSIFVITQHHTRARAVLFFRCCCRLWEFSYKISPRFPVFYLPCRVANCIAKWKIKNYSTVYYEHQLNFRFRHHSQRLLYSFRRF